RTRFGRTSRCFGLNGSDGGCTRGRRRNRRCALQPTHVIKSRCVEFVRFQWIDLSRRCYPIVCLFRIIVLVLPRRLRVIKRRGITAELKFFHQFLSAAILCFQQEGQEDLEVDQLRGVVLVSTGRLL